MVSGAGVSTYQLRAGHAREFVPNCTFQCILAVAPIIKPFKVPLTYFGFRSDASVSTKSATRITKGKVLDVETSGNLPHSKLLIASKIPGISIA